MKRVKTWWKISNGFLEAMRSAGKPKCDESQDVKIILNDDEVAHWDVCQILATKNSLTCCKCPMLNLMLILVWYFVNFLHKYAYNVALASKLERDGKFS